MASDTTSRSGVGVVSAAVAIIALIGILVWWCCTRQETAGEKDRGGRVATILAVNDIYRIDGVGEKQIGGLHRLRTLRKTLEKEGNKVLLLHAGDFLSPSLESRVFKGEQMIDAMNNLDGDPKKFDARMFVTFGNHEFDDSDCNKSPAPLIARLNESQFTWLNVNLDFSSCASMKDVTAHKNVKRTAIVELNGIKFGIFGIGLTPDVKDTKKHPAFGDIYDAARAAIKELREKKAEVIVALTHLEEKDDEMLVRSLAGYGVHLLIGGHDHTRTMIYDKDPGVSGRKLRGFKADSDAKSAWVIKVRVTGKGKAELEVEAEAEGPGKDKPVELDGRDKRTEPDKDMEKLATKWWDQAEAKFCAMRKQAGRSNHGDKCLQTTVTKTAIPISLEEGNNRNSETKFGQWIAGIVKRETGAEVAIVNAGILGLNTNLLAKSELQYKDVLDIFRYDNVVAVRNVPAKSVCDALRLGFSKPGTGAWPHVVGIGKPDTTPDDPKLDTPKALKEEAARVEKKWAEVLDGFDKCKEPASKDEKPQMLTIASVPYVMCGGDDYPFLAGGDEGEGTRSEKVTRCIDALTRNPIKGRKSAVISVMAEDAILADGITLPIPEKKPAN